MSEPREDDRRSRTVYECGCVLEGFDGPRDRSGDIPKGGWDHQPLTCPTHGSIWARKDPIAAPSKPPVTGQGEECPKSVCGPALRPGPCFCRKSERRGVVTYEARVPVPVVDARLTPARATDAMRILAEYGVPTFERKAAVRRVALAFGLQEDGPVPGFTEGQES